MAVTTEAQFRDESGEVRLEGTIGAPGATASNVLTADGAGGTSWSPAAAPYVPPVGLQQVVGNNVSINNGAQSLLGWNTPSGDALFDLTAPTVPTAEAAGVYAVSVTVKAQDAMTATGWYQVNLVLDNAGASPAVICDSAPASVVDTQPTLAVTVVAYVPLAGTLALFVTNQDGANAIHFSITQATIQRIS